MRISDWSSDVCSSDLHVYIEQGCLYCHSQQPRSADQAPDDERGWGRASVASDYAYDHPHLMGTMRTGPDLLNVGARLPSRDWQLTHLYQPRAISKWSIMPAYPYLFEKKAKAARSEEHTSELKSLMRIQYALFCFEQ